MHLKEVRGMLGRILYAKEDKVFIVLYDGRQFHPLPCILSSLSPYPEGLHQLPDSQFFYPLMHSGKVCEFFEHLPLGIIYIVTAKEP